MTSKTVFLNVLTALALLLTPWVVHAESAEADEAKAMLDKAVDLFSKEGHVRAICAINTDRESFVKGELYVFVINLQGTIFAHSVDPYITGVSYKGVVDARGTPLGKNIIELATTKGEGSVEYFWPNYKTNEVEKKHTFIKHIKETDFVVGVGYYIREKAVK
ncbi:MAG: cache domain-containing protein [Gammaproteobacteria bacterium]|nr:cache domain-containing protein [Gammaproteobacteria bacterium]